VVNADLAKMEAPGVTQAQSNSIANQIDVQIMKDAVFLPAVYSKALLYRSPSLSNVLVQPYYGMYDFGSLGMK
jgi:peptide/nickel transport system substrate-binding protein